MGAKNSKTPSELDLDKIEELDDENKFAKKGKHLEPDLIGAKLAAKAGCAAVIGKDMIFHAGNAEYTHHPAGYKIAPKNGLYFFAQADKNQPKLPYETMDFSAPYNRKQNGEEVGINLQGFSNNEEETDAEISTEQTTENVETLSETIEPTPA